MSKPIAPVEFTTGAIPIRIDEPVAPSHFLDTAAILQTIERAARDPSVDIDKMERLLQMQERVFARNVEQAFGIAMAEAQAEIRRVAADSDNGQTNSKYASYAAIDRQVRPIYTKHGFALSYDTEAGAPDLHIRIVCYAFHEGGHKRKYQIDMPVDGKGAKGGDVMTKTHAVVSGVTYGQRCLTRLIFNIAIGEDDDGNAAGGNPFARFTKAQARTAYARLQAEIDAAPSTVELDRWGHENADRIHRQPEDWEESLRARYSEMMACLREREKNPAPEVVWEENGERPVTPADLADRPTIGNFPPNVPRRQVSVLDKPLTQAIEVIVDPFDIPPALRRTIPDQAHAKTLPDWADHFAGCEG